MHDKQKILDFIRSKPHMAVSTINANSLPQSAVVGFGVTEEFELIFGTSRLSRKAQNIAVNPHVSVIIGWDESGTVQHEGAARQLTGKDIDAYTKHYYSKNPHAMVYRDDPDERYFLISPSWLRFTEVYEHPWAITELQFAD